MTSRRTPTLRSSWPLVGLSCVLVIGLSLMTYAAAVHGRAKAEHPREPKVIMPQEPGVIRPGADSLRGQLFPIRSGRIPLVELLRLAANYTGLPVIFEPDERNREIVFVSNVDLANDEVIKAILEVNKYRLFREVLPSGKEVLKVELMQMANRSFK